MLFRHLKTLPDLIRKNIPINLVLFIILSLSELSAQDIHLSQFNYSPLNINPALTGIFPQDIRFSGIYRKQWESVPVPYMTFSGAYDTKIFNRVAPNGFFGAGLLFNYDKQGTAALKLTQIALSGSYTQRLNDYNYLTVGLQIGTVNRGFSMEGLQFENQYNGDIFDPGLPTRENFEDTNISFLDYGTGINWHFQADQGLSLDAGTGIFHLSRPYQNFYNQTTDRLPLRTSVYIIGKTPVHPKMNLLIHAMTQFQGAYFEMVGGTAIEYALISTRGKEVSLQLGSNFRYADESDAIIPTFGIQYLSWQFGLSYDINISQFKEATNGNGGPEIALIYTIAKVKPPKTFKACPIF